MNSSRQPLRVLDRAWLRLTEFVFRRKLTWTDRARIVLVFAPVLLPFLVLHALYWAVRVAAVEFGQSIKASWNDGWHFWYREVYRVARYGSVHDE